MSERMSNVRLEEIREYFESDASFVGEGDETLAEIDRAREAEKRLEEKVRRYEINRKNLKEQLDNLLTGYEVSKVKEENAALKKQIDSIFCPHCTNEKNKEL